MREPGDETDDQGVPLALYDAEPVDGHGHPYHEGRAIGQMIHENLTRPIGAPPRFLPVEEEAAIENARHQPNFDLMNHDGHANAITVVPKLAPGEIVIEPETRVESAGTLVITPAQKAILLQKIPAEDIDIKPSGEVFASQIRYRRILNDAFDPGAWGLRPVGPPAREQQPTAHVSQEWALYVKGAYVSQAWGEQDFEMGTNVLTFATALEGCKSTALVRCCKDLGIASELWDRHYTQRFIAEHCVQVWVDKKSKPQWRRKDAQPFYGERGFVDAPPSAGNAPSRPSAPPTQPMAPPPPPSPPPGGIAIADVRLKTFSKRDGSQGRSWVITDTMGTVFETVDVNTGSLAEGCWKAESLVEIVSQVNGNFPRRITSLRAV